MSLHVPTERAGPSGALAALVAALALVSLTVGLGAVDLVSLGAPRGHPGQATSATARSPGSRSRSGLLAQLRRRRGRVAGIQQVAAAAIAYLVAGTLAGRAAAARRGRLVAAAAAVVGGACHPGARPPPRAAATVTSRPRAGRSPSCAPGSQYALHMAFNQRDGALPDDAHLGLRHWAALAAAALAVLFTALVAA